MEETNFIHRYQMMNKKLDLETRMTETEARRKQIADQKAMSLQSKRED